MHLKFYETWDAMWRFGDHPDVVVEFDQLPAKFVFWRGTGFIPMIVNEKGQWYSNEFNETWGTSGGQGCQEPMSDKEGHTNHVRIIENTPARAVVHWRYPLLDVLRVTANYDEETGWGDWSDWYYTIYPDGVAVKRMRLWTHGRRNHEWQESMAIFGPDQHPEQIIETKDTLTLADLSGAHKTYDWIGGPPRIRGAEFRGKNIHLVNYKARYDPFTIGTFAGGDVYGGEVTPYAVFPTWNHWPVAQMPSDGRYASFPDRTAHSSLTHVPPTVYREEDSFQERLLMEGMTDKGALELVPLARSWLRAADLTVSSGCSSDGFDPSQRAYPVVARASDLAFTVAASEESPLVNPCFVIRNWGSQARAAVKVNGKIRARGPDTREGTIRDTDGTYTKILWLQMTARSPVNISVGGATPDLSGPTPGALKWERT